MPAPATGHTGRVTAFLGTRRGALITMGVIIAAFLVFGVAWGVAHPAVFVKAGGDGEFIEIMAKQMLTTGVYAYKATTPNAIRTPAYPLFLAAVYAITGSARSTGGPHVLVYWLQLLFAAGSIVLTYLIGSEIFGRRPGLFAALLMALYPPMQQSAVKILTEPMTMLLFLAYVYVQLLAIRRDRRWLWLLTGVLFAGAVMVRPNLAVVGIVPLAYVLFAKHDWRRLLVQTALLAVGFALVVSPWVVRNVVTLHRPVVLADQTGDPLLAGIDPYHYELGWTYRYAGPSYLAYVKANAQAATGTVPAEFQVSKTTYALRVLGGMLRHQPARTVEWFTLGKLRSMFARLWEDGGGRTMTSVTWTIQFALVGLGFLGMALSFRDRRFRLLTFMIIVGVITLLPYVPEPRYVFSFMPLLAVLGAGAVMRAWEAPGPDGPEPVGDAPARETETEMPVARS